MRKIILLVIISLFSISQSYWYSCDQTFEWKLRYWYEYRFYDEFSNNSWKSVWISSVDVNYTEEYDYNGSSNFPTFSWTTWFAWKGYVLNNGDSGRVIEADSKYPINYYPATRSRNNFVIQYDAEYYEKVGWVWSSTPKRHTECKYYEVTWCWDGIVDSDYGEVCDPNDASKSWWWVWGCEVNTCQPITTPTTPTCTWLSVNPTTSPTAVTWSLSCTWLNATTYKIDIEKDGSIVNTINSSAWTYNFSEDWIYTATCYVDTTITDPSCRQTITIWDTPPTTTTTTTTTSTTSWGSSGGSSWGSSWSSWSSWGSTGSSGWGSNYCWDGRVQRPNDDFELEECDFWSESDWGTCNKTTCKIEWTVSFPSDWELVFWPSDSVIIWWGMNPYSEYTLDKPSIFNNSDYDFYFDDLCVVKKSWTSLAWNTVCEPIWSILPSRWRYTFSNYPNFTWLTSSIAAWSYNDNVLVTTIEHDWVLYDDAYFASELLVRVSKPSISTTWWGTSYVKSTTNISDVSSVANNWELNPAENKNFVWAWISNWTISSYSTDVTDSDSVDKVSQEWDNYNTNATNYSELDWTTLGNTYDINEFENYNWINNAFILKDTDFIIKSNTFNWLAWARTYVLENWNFIIEDDITYPDNIAFVVKWWSIKIDSSVENINWVFISIPNWSIWWEIEWINGDTTNVLTVNGSLYWNIEKLVEHRTYVKQNSSWQLDVWTIVSFGSSVFRDPAPLISTFISEYLDATKVAQ